MGNFLLAAERRFFSTYVREGTAHHNVPLAVLLEGPLSIANLTSVVAKVCERHVALTTIFELEKSTRPRRIVRKDRIVLEHLVYATQPAGHADGLEELIRDLASQPFQIDVGPLIRFRLITISTQRHILLTVASHLVCDGFSMQVLINEIGSSYACTEKGISPTITASIDPEEAAIQQMSYLQSDQAQDSLAFWRYQCENYVFEPKSFFGGKARRPCEVMSTLAATSVVPADLQVELRRRSDATGLSTFTLLTAALARLIGERTGDSKVAICFPTANRTTALQRSSIGLYANTLPLFVDCATGTSADQLIAIVARAVYAALKHRAIPFDLILRQFPPACLNSPGSHVASVMINMYPVVVGPKLFGDTMATSPFKVSYQGESVNQLAFLFGYRRDELHVALRYANALFSDFEINSLIVDYFASLGCLLREAR